MPKPTIVIELVEGRFEALHSSSELSFIVVNRRGRENEPPDITGPYLPTLEKPRLTLALPDIAIPDELFEQHATQPYF